MPSRDHNGVVLRNVGLQLGTQDFSFSCDVPGRAITAITGPSGSGKTTLLQLIAGFVQTDSGTIFIDGADVTTLHPSRRPVSIIFQDNNLFSHLDIFTNVALGISPSLKLSADDTAAVHAALERVGLGGFGPRHPGTLSGGERQRAALARTLVRRRPLLLLDEPFAALDPGMRQDMADLVRELQQEQRSTVLIVSHNPAEVSHLASNVLFLDAGRIAFSGTNAEFAASDLPQIGTFRGAGR